MTQPTRLHITQLLDHENLQRMIAEKYIRTQRHPTLPLTIYNYSEHAQFDRVWNTETLTCRGLVVDDEGFVVARPFPKFFNLEEWEGMGKTLPPGRFEVTEKMDGSLGICFHFDGEWHVATRGSFVSEQAEVGRDMLLSERTDSLDPAYTYLVEIVYPGNRIVVDYDGRSFLCHLATIETATGRELPDADMPWPRVLAYTTNTLEAVRALERPNSEGVVLRFEDGTRLKVKWAEYKRLHKLLTGVNERHLWEMLKGWHPLGELLELVPDEYHRWVEYTVRDLRWRYSEIETVCVKQFARRPVTDDRKTQALYFQKCDYPSVLFAMLDRKPYAETIWKLIRPECARPFRQEEAA